MLRTVRRWLTARATDVAMAAAPRLTTRTIDRIGPLLHHWGPSCPVIARIVADNMRALGVYSDEAHHGYFAQLGEHLAGALHMLRYANHTNACPKTSVAPVFNQWKTQVTNLCHKWGTGSSNGAMDQELSAIVAQRIELDDSIVALQEVVASDRGAIIVGPHINNYLLNLARLNQVVPLTIYLRYSKDARRREVKQRWYRASGVGWISEPADAGGSLGRLGRMAAALRAGRVLFITPDLPRKRGDGTPVRFFNREIYLPAGPALLSLRSEAPLFTLVARPAGGRQRLILHGPFVAEQSERGRTARQAGIQRRLQWFTSEFERFLEAYPELWYLWGDKRWTCLLRGDPRYVRPLDQPAATIAANPTEIAGAV